MQFNHKNIFWLIPFLSFFLGYISFDRLFRPAQIETPSVIGTTIYQALTILCAAHLNARVVEGQEDEMLAQGTIISQTPTPGQKIKENQSVFLVISSKPKKLKAPNCINKSITSLEAELITQKIKIKPYYLESIYPKGLCFAQNPEPDQELNDNKMILYISSGSTKPYIMPNFKGKYAHEIMEFLSTKTVNTELFHYAEQENHQCVACIIRDQRPLAGSIISMNSEKPLHIQLQTQ